jgi:serine phosphatase RsbU (regulator of sigma subunit)
MSRSLPWQASSGAVDTDATGATGFAEAAIRAAGIGTWDWHVGSGWLRLDKPAMELLGIDPETYDGFIRTWTSLIHPDDSSRVAEETRRAMLTLGPFGLEYRICRQDGATQRIQVRGRVLADPDGRPYRLLGAMWDATRSRDDTDGPEAEQAAEPGSADRAARIQDLATALAEAVTVADVVTAVANWILPPFGAKSLIIGVSENGMNRVIGSVGVSQAHIDRVTAPVGELPQVAEAMRTHTPWFISSPEEYVQHYPGLGDMPALGRNKAWAYLPLVVSGQTVGLCVISFGHPRRLTEAERALLIAISGLIAQAFERARLFDAEHARAQALQRELLPQELPTLPAITAAAKYLPAGRGVDVGGDWYDVIPLSADRVALVIGDVMGHGLPEAVIMGRLRTAVQTLSDLELPPDEILGRLSELVSGLGDDSFATCLYAIYDPTTGICSIARAGHPPPAIVYPDGRVCFAKGHGDPPLGVAEPPFEVVDLPVPPDGLLVLYTDGLIESAGCDVDSGMNRLAELLGSLPRQDLNQLSNSLTQALMPADGDNSDDAALLVVRVQATDPDSIATWSLPESPQAASAARTYVRETLAAWCLDDMAMTTEMLASELVANVVRHAKGPMRLRLLRSQSLVCEVFDGSLTTPRIRRASWADEGGRGLQLIAALSDRWGTRYMTTGKCIWTEQSLPERRTPMPL